MAIGIQTEWKLNRWVAAGTLGEGLVTATTPVTGLIWVNAYMIHPLLISLEGDFVAGVNGVQILGSGSQIRPLATDNTKALIGAAAFGKGNILTDGPYQFIKLYIPDALVSGVLSVYVGAAALL
jgi:hypothetical protein